MAKNYMGKPIPESQKGCQPSIPIEVSKGVFMTRNAVWKIAKGIMKNHGRMDGSGHLLQKNPENGFKVPDLNAMIAYVKAELKKQDINPAKCRIEPLVQSCLPKLVGRKDWHHKRDIGEQINHKRRLEKEALRNAKILKKREAQANCGKTSERSERSTKSEPAVNQTPFPTLTLKSNARQETRTITVTVKKSRNFHYPLDLPNAGGEQ